MGIARIVACCALAVAGAGLMAGCDDSRKDSRPDMDRIMKGDKGLQSRDLREMTDRMAPDLLQIPEIVQNQYRVTVVVKAPTVQSETNIGRDKSIFVKRLALNLGRSARDRIAFVDEYSQLTRMQAEELGNRDPFETGGRGADGPDPRQKPQYYLTGEFNEMNNGRTTYYLCSFKLVNIMTGVQVWQDYYETRTLN